MSNIVDYDPSTHAAFYYDTDQSVFPMVGDIVRSCANLKLFPQGSFGCVSDVAYIDGSRVMLYIDGATRNDEDEVQKRILVGHVKLMSRTRNPDFSKLSAASCLRFAAKEAVEIEKFAALVENAKKIGLFRISVPGHGGVIDVSLADKEVLAVFEDMISMSTEQSTGLINSCISKSLP